MCERGDGRSNREREKKRNIKGERARQKEREVKKEEERDRGGRDGERVREGGRKVRGEIEVGSFVSVEQLSASVRDQD